MKSAILGSGNIGTDLLFKLERSPHLEVAMMVGIDPESEGLRIAWERGHLTAARGVRAILEADPVPEFVFDATSASAHVIHSRLLAEAGVRHVLDLTPAAVGPAVFPTVNLDHVVDQQNVNLVSCAAQATVPLIAAISAVTEVAYAETVSTVASASAGPGTRANIDEFTRKTTRAIEEVGGAARGKAIVLLNPSDPPMTMRNTLYLKVAEADPEAMEAALDQAVERIRAFAPGYRVRDRVIEPGSLTVYTEVGGSGDYLPEYAGNLDIITAAAVAVAHGMARVAVSKEAVR